MLVKNALRLLGYPSCYLGCDLSRVERCLGLVPSRIEIGQVLSGRPKCLVGASS